MRERLAWIDAARGLALALVVLLHTTAWLRHSGFDVSPLVRDLNAILDGFRMPTLVLLSGILAVSVSTWSWGEVLRRRVGPFALLYVVWTPIVAVVIHWVRTGSIGIEPSTLTGLLIRPDERTWYLYALAIYIAGARLLRAVPTVPLLIVATVANLWAVAWLQNATLPLGMQSWAYVLEHWVFFVAAERFALAYRRLSARRSPMLGLASVGVFGVFGVFAIAAGVITNSFVTLVLGVLGTVVTLTLIPVVGGSPALGWARAVGRRSLGVYVTHAAIAALVTAIVAPLLPRFKGAGVLFPLCVAAAVLAIAYGVSVALERWAPVPFLRPWWNTAGRAVATEQSEARAQAQ